MSVLKKFKVKPQPTDERLKMIVFGKAGSGKSHFAARFPDSIYVDTEGLVKYQKFRRMAEKNNVLMNELYNLDEIIELVKELLTQEHEFKTIIIDSLSNIFKLECELEAQRLGKLAKQKGKDDTEGTEFGRNKSVPKRKILFLVNLLSRLDMNVIVTCHPKTKHANGSEIGDDQDVSVDIEHALGTKIEMNYRGSFPSKGVVIKSRFDEVPQGEIIDMTYAWFVKAMGEDIFTHSAKPVELATQEQIDKLKKLIHAFDVPVETVNKWLTKAKSSELSEMTSEQVGACIEMLEKRIKE